MLLREDLLAIGKRNVERGQELVLLLIRSGELLEAQTQLPLELLALRDVDDRAEGQQPFIGLDRVEANLDRKLGTVLAPAVQISTGTHRA